jgi:crotonobetainyl-CoA:carnitine CoA-transferase CaiB-like acyl-CoA transferase
VIDFSTIVAGPWATRLLADCGAEVIKIEAAGEGDLLRHTPPIVDGVSLVYAHFNCGKQSIALDLKTDTGLALARELIGKADVLVENFRPGVMARLGLDYAAVSALNPRLVYCSISGFGQSGPSAGLAAYAPVVQAASGFEHVLMRAQGTAEPLVAGIMIADVVAAVYAFGAIQTALIQRARTNKGAHVDTTLLESIMSVIAIQFQENQSPKPIAPSRFKPLRTQDGFVMVPLVSARNYLALYPLIGKPEWAKTRARLIDILPNRKEIEDAFAVWMQTQASGEALDKLRGAGIPCSAYRSPQDVLGDLDDRGLFAAMPGGYRVLNPPFRLSNASCTADGRVAGPGEDTERVLRSLLDMSPGEIADNRRCGAFG